MTGALAGAVVGVLVGFHHIRRASELAAAGVEEARTEIPDQETFLSELGMDGIFSKAEVATGEPDPDDVGRNYPDWPL